MLLQAFGAGLESESAFKISDWSRSKKLATPLHSSGADSTVSSLYSKPL